MQRLLVKLPNWMGDILFSYDLLYSLSFHVEHLALVTSSQHRELFDMFPIPRTEVIAYPAETWPNFSAETVKAIEDFRAEGALILPNSIGAALVLKYASRAPLYGYATERRGFLLKKSLPAPVFRMHQSDYYLQLLRLFDAERRIYPVEGSTDRRRRVVIHPGASKIERAWQMDRFLEVAQLLRQEKYEVCFVSGERLSAQDFDVLHSPSIGKFVDLLRSSALFIGNDSGPLHLAQQAGTPIVGIYGPGNPLTTGPRAITPNRVVYHAFPCSPCRQNFFEECSPSPNGKPFCLETIRVEEVVNAALALLK